MKLGINIFLIFTNIGHFDFNPLKKKDFGSSFFQYYVLNPYHFKSVPISILKYAFSS